MSIPEILSHYRILHKIGEGGMGEVYAAEDTRLGRTVALKVLPEAMADDAERLARFQREARTVASFTHPNIVTIHSVEESDGYHFITMEYLEGDTLEASVRPGGLELRRLVELARAIASALAAAHDRGIIHRDLKPSNVMVTRDGHLKVLDFGLAKLRETADPGPDDLTRGLATEKGMLLGTMPYMSPEQVQGRTVGPRSDIFSFGVLLYELATGDRPFGGESAAELISSILRDSPRPASDINRTVPTELGKILRRCLEKAPSSRYASVRELADDLGTLVSSSDAGTPARSEASIAVLPFANMSPDPEQEYFCDGMAEEVINALTKVEGLRVLARTSSFQFKGRDEDPRVVGDKLDVATLLEGSVRKVGNRLRITAQLVSTADGSHLWSERYDRELADVFEIQDEISRAIVKRLKRELVGEEDVHLVTRPTENMEAYNLYLEATHHMGFESLDGCRRAIELLERVVALEPGFALAWVGIAKSHMLLAGYGLVPLEKSLTPAEDALERALAIDGSLSEAHRTRGSILAWLRWDWVGAAAAYERGGKLQRPSAREHQNYAAIFLAPLGRLDEAERELRIALDLDPLSPVRSRVLGQILYWSRQYDKAVAQLRHTLELDPTFPLARSLLAAVYTSQGRHDESVRERQIELRAMGREAAAQELGREYEKRGVEGLLHWQIGKGLARAAAGKGGGAYNLALLYSLLDAKDDAFRWLEKAYEERGGLTVYVKVHPWFDNLRPDPRFNAFLDKMGLNDPRVTVPA